MPRHYTLHGDTAFSTFNSHNRVATLSDGRHRLGVARPRARIVPVRDRVTEEASRMAQWEESPLPKVWDSWFLDDNCDDDDGRTARKDAVAEKSDRTLKTCPRGGASSDDEHFPAELDVVKDCQTRRASSDLPGLNAMERSLAWWVFRMLLRHFNIWRKRTRIRSWMHSRPDPYGFIAKTETAPPTKSDDIGDRRVSVSPSSVIVKVGIDGQLCEDGDEDANFKKDSVFSFRARDDYLDDILVKKIAAKAAAKAKHAFLLKRRRQATLNQLEDVPHNDTVALFEDPRFDEAAAYVDRHLINKINSAKYGVESSQQLEHVVGSISTCDLLKVRMDFLTEQARKERQRKKDAEQRQRVQDVASAKHWMQKNLHDEQESIQLRLGKIFERQMLEEGRSVRDIFMAFDEDGGGTIDRDELHDGFKVLGVELSEDEFQSMLSVWDSENTGEIEFNAFTAMFEKTLLLLEMDRNRAAQEWMNANMRDDQKAIQKSIAEKFQLLIDVEGKTIRDIFVAFDDDGGGTIDHKELRDGLTSLGIELDDKDFIVMLNVWDPDLKGEIEFDAFTDMFEKTLMVLKNGISDKSKGSAASDAEAASMTEAAKNDDPMLKRARSGVVIRN
eukprot:g3024.t1